MSRRDRLLADPRFAAIAAGVPADLPGIEYLADDDPPPDAAAVRRQEERTELMRRAKLALIARAAAGQPVDPRDLAGAREFVAAHRPLERPLGTGDPA